jgi:dTDP-4-dehydrorhamnose reductase
MDIADRESVVRMLEAVRPWATINTAGYFRVDEAESEVARCMRENRDGPAVLAEESRARGLPLVTFSSDLVFDGAKGSAYLESDVVSPLNVYGRSKAEAERLVGTAHPDALMIRTSAFFGPWDRQNFVYHALRTLAAGQELAAADDAVVSPTYVPDLVNATLDLLVDGETGIWHLANVGRTTWAELARRAATLANVSIRGLVCRPTRELHLAARRPLASVLASERGWVMPGLDDALCRCIAEAKYTWRIDE